MERIAFALAVVAVPALVLKHIALALPVVASSASVMKLITPAHAGRVGLSALRRGV